MFLLTTVSVFAVIQHGVATSLRSEEVLSQCRATYSEDLNNDYLLGEWFEVMKYTFFGGYGPSSSCGNQVFYKATAENLTAYETAYGVTVSMEDNPLLINRANYSLNLVAGNIQAKEWYSQPTMPGKTVTVYKRLTDDYALVWDCALRGMTIWLHSRTRHPTDEEIAEVTQGVAEVTRLEGSRYCSLV